MAIAMAILAQVPTKDRVEFDMAVAAGVGFSGYDLDGDNFIDGIAFFHLGEGSEWGGTDSNGQSQSNRIWSHKWGKKTEN